MALRIDTAQPDERDAIVTLLQKAGLLTDDLPTDLADFLLAWDGADLIGVAGLERHASVGLLRSVAVDPAHRNTGIAARLIERLLATADATHLQATYLITTTAESFSAAMASLLSVDMKCRTPFGKPGNSVVFAPHRPWS